MPKALELEKDVKRIPNSVIAPMVLGRTVSFRLAVESLEVLESD